MTCQRCACLPGCTPATVLVLVACMCPTPTALPTLQANNAALVAQLEALGGMADAGEREQFHQQVRPPPLCFLLPHLACRPASAATLIAPTHPCPAGGSS